MELTDSAGGSYSAGMDSAAEAQDLSIRILHWTMTSPVFKGVGCVILGAIGLMIGWRAHQKGEKIEFGFRIYLIAAAFKIGRAHV